MLRLLERFAAFVAISTTVVAPALAQRQVRVVATLPTYASIAREITGDLADVQAIARGDEDPHFVNPRPSFAAMIQRADVFIVTGLDLELWVPALMDRANNPKVVEGAPGHVTAYAGVKLLDVPETVSRAGGDIHVFGNPHIHTDPINGIIIARNIADGLKRVDPGNAGTYDSNLRSFENRILRRLFGDRLVDMLGAEQLFALARDYKFWDFAKAQSFQGRPLADYVGGWLAAGAPFRDQRMVCYHKNWAYLSARFQVTCAMYVEGKPGIPPTPGHVADVIAFIQQEHIPVLLAANYFSRSQVERVASRTGATAVIVPEHVGGAEGVNDYFDLVERWVSALAAGFGSTPHP
ncbi:MAG: zinc ABC transporter substrate-binding protein [Gemmatimonadales bacterium]|nr:zinc ABC transporter substrate-binding protein [Gemmatimonadales bacterium]